MKLSDYFKQTGEKPETFAPKINRSPKQVYEYLAGNAKPRDDAMLLMMRATEGKVTANDFLSKEQA